MSPRGNGPVGVGPFTAKVFISYSRRDLNFADRIDTALKARSFDTLIDRSDIYALEDWWTRIEALIAQADTIVFILSPDAVASDVCQREVRFATSLNKRLAPIVCRRVDDKAVPTELAKLNFIFFDEPERFDDSLERLAEALETDVDWVRKHTEFGEQARRWVIAGRPGPRGLLLRPPVLDEAEGWIASRPRGAPMPTDAVQAFIVASRHAHTRRRSIFTTGLAAGLFVALALAGLAYWQRGIAVEQRLLAEKQRGIAVEQQKLAERNYAAAIHAVDGLIADLALGFKDQEGISLPAISKILERSDDILTDLIGFSPNDPQLIKLRLTNLILIQDIFLDRGGDTDPAERAVNTAQDYLKQLLASDPTNIEFRKFLARTNRNSGRIFMVDREQPSALAAFQTALSITESLLAENPQDVAMNRTCAHLHADIGTALQSLGQPRAALDQFRTSQKILDQLIQDFPNDSDDNLDTAYELSLVWGKIGEALMLQNDTAAALGAFHEDLKISEKLDRYSTNTKEEYHLANVLENIGDIFIIKMNFAEAYSNYASAFPILQRLVAVDPENTQWPAQLAMVYRKSGDALLAQGQLAEALENFHSALRADPRRMDSR